MENDMISLVERARRGEKEAFAQLFLAEKEYLYKTAFLHAGNEEDALDLVQECILQCMLSIKKLKHPEYFRTWMTRILINCARKEWYKKKRYAPEEDLEERSPSHEDGVTSEEKMDLYQAIDTLPFLYRSIVVEKYFAGAKLEEIAQMLDMPLGTVKVYHGRAKKQLRELLKEEI